LVPLRVAVNTCVLPSPRLLLEGLRVTAMLSVTVAVVVVETLATAALTILKVIGFGLGTSTEGAVYLHVRGAEVVQAVRVPCAALPLVTPLTLQVSPKLEVLVTVAVKVRVPPKATVGAEVFSARVTAGMVTVYAMLAVELVPARISAAVPLTMVTVNLYVPGVVGVPARVAWALPDTTLGTGQEPLGAKPALLVKDNPGGSEPEVMHHMSGPGPPVAWIGVL
jgi:hypothetical protein